MHWQQTTLSTLWLAAAAIQFGSLLVAARADLNSRTIPDGACLALGIAGATTRLLAGPLALAGSAAFALLLFVLLVLLHARGVLGGGDIKLLVAATLGQPISGAVGLIAVTALAGGVLAVLHLALRRLPRPAHAPAGSFWPRRVYAAERWRILRHAPLPYGIAIACGGVWALLTNPMG